MGAAQGGLGHTQVGQHRNLPFCGRPAMAAHGRNDEWGGAIFLQAAYSCRQDFGDLAYAATACRNGNALALAGGRDAGQAVDGLVYG